MHPEPVEERTGEPSIAPAITRGDGSRTVPNRHYGSRDSAYPVSPMKAGIHRPKSKRARQTGRYPGWDWDHRARPMAAARSPLIF